MAARANAGRRWNGFVPLRGLGAFGTESWCRKSPPEPDDRPPVLCPSSRRPAVLQGTPGSAIASALAALHTCHPRPVNGYHQPGHGRCRDVPGRSRSWAEGDNRIGIVQGRGRWRRGEPSRPRRLSVMAPLWQGRARPGGAHYGTLFSAFKRRHFGEGDTPDRVASRKGPGGGPPAWRALRRRSRNELLRALPELGPTGDR